MTPKNTLPLTLIFMLVGAHAGAQELPGSERVITGLVASRDAEGRPQVIDGALVKLLDQHGRLEDATTTDRGRFRFEVAKPGARVLRVTHRDYEGSRVTVLPTAAVTTCNVDLRPRRPTIVPFILPGESYDGYRVEAVRLARGIEAGDDRLTSPHAGPITLVRGGRKASESHYLWS